MLKFVVFPRFYGENTLKCKILTMAPIAKIPTPTHCPHNIYQHYQKLNKECTDIRDLTQQNVHLFIINSILLLPNNVAKISSNCLCNHQIFGILAPNVKVVDVSAF
jgi:hypothetical protein